MEALRSQLFRQKCVILQINQVTKDAEIPPIQYMDEVRKCPSINKVTKHVEFPQTQHIDGVVVVPRTFIDGGSYPRARGTARRGAHGETCQFHSTRWSSYEASSCWC